MGIGDLQYTVLEIEQEVFRKLGLNTPSSLTDNKLTIQMVDFINDVVSDISDYGNWQESLVSANVVAVSGQRDYSFSASANVKNIGDIFYSQRTGPLRNITVSDMRVLTRVTSVGTPSQFTVFGIDVNGNPNVRVNPIPVDTSAQYFSTTFYSRPPKYTTSDASTRVPFPGDTVVAGVLAMAILNESEGAPTDRYTRTYQIYQDMIKESFNRYNGDTGYTVSFTPSIIGRRR